MFYFENVFIFSLKYTGVKYSVNWASFSLLAKSDLRARTGNIFEYIYFSTKPARFSHSKRILGFE